MSSLAAARTGEVDRVSRSLLGRIVGGAFPPGVRLPAELDLATELGCGRSTVREALSQLSTLGVVASRRGSGAHVLDWRREGTPALLPFYLAAGAHDEAPRTVVELLRIRRLLACEATRLASLYASPGAIAEIRRELDRGRGETDPVRHAVRELELFRRLVVSSGVWPAVWFANSFFGPMRELHGLLAPLAGGPPRDFESAMQKLLMLVEARDEKRAGLHLDGWLARVDTELTGRLMGAFASKASPPPEGPRRRKPTTMARKKKRTAPK